MSDTGHQSSSGDLREDSGTMDTEMRCVKVEYARLLGLLWYAQSFCDGEHAARICFRKERDALEYAKAVTSRKVSPWAPGSKAVFG